MTAHEKALEDAKAARERIAAGEWALCYICAKVFGRRRETNRYCSDCGHGYCEGEHGTFWPFKGRRALCLTCVFRAIK